MSKLVASLVQLKVMLSLVTALTAKPVATKHEGALVKVVFGKNAKWLGEVCVVYV